MADNKNSYSVRVVEFNVDIWFVHSTTDIYSMYPKYVERNNPNDTKYQSNVLQDIT